MSGYQHGQPYPAAPGQYAPPVPYPGQPASQYPAPGPGQYPAPESGQYPAGPPPYQPAVTTAAPMTQAPPPQQQPPAAGFAFPSMPGYDNTNFNSGFVAPPPQPAPSAPPTASAPIEVDLQPLSNDEVREALAAFVSQHCCYGSGPARQLHIGDVAPSATFKYTLETFVEKRETAWKCEPTSQNNYPAPVGPAPGPWEIPVNPKQMFKDEVREMEVPNTATVRPCHDCGGHGDVRCDHCAGRGRDRCKACGGSGSRLGDQCSACAGMGTTDCTWCHSRGMVTCKTCKGQRNVKFYVNLKITWKVHPDRYVIETRGLPDDEVKKYSGETVTQSEGSMVWPLTGFPEPRVAQASTHLVKKHHTGWPMGRILRQRQDVQLIPIYEVGYQYKSNAGRFFVSGQEKAVYFPDYPAKCCCTII